MVVTHRKYKDQQLDMLLGIDDYQSSEDKSDDDELSNKTPLEYEST